MNKQTIFQPASNLLIEQIRCQNEREKITFLLPTKYISEEAATVGYLINREINKQRKEPTIYRTFFGSSHLEAIYGTIKIFRHNSWLKEKRPSKKIVIYDPKNEIESFFNPLQTEEEKALIRGIEFCHDLKKVKDCLLSCSTNYIGFICCHDGGVAYEEIDQLFAICKKFSLFTALDEAYIEDWYERHTASLYVFENPPDVVLYGENLTHHEIPYGSFSMTKEMYQPWNNIDNCLNHSSSYSCNTISLAMVLALFKKYSLAENIEHITKNRKNRFKTYRTYVNPKIGVIFEVTRLSPEVKKAKGSKLTLEQGEIIDCIAGSGCCLRGHNPSDVIENIVHQHDPSVDYWSSFCRLLSDLTGLPHIFPAVSGSSAVDTAVILSLLANPKKTRLVTFHNNYSGKSLIALNLTRYEIYRQAFYPLYFDVVSIDPFSSDAKALLTQELQSGQVALIWFEMMQGQNLDIIPDELIEVIKENREKGGYLIGIDEILTGMFRTGNFLFSQEKLPDPDVVTIAKGIGDMTFPLAAVLVSERVYTQAQSFRKDMVDKLQSYFVNQLGAHIALNALKSAIDNDLGKHVKEMGNLFKERLSPIVKTSSFINEVRGEGLLLYLKLNKKAFPINLIGEELVEFLMSSQYLNRGKVLFLNSRLTPSLCISREEVEKVCTALEKTLKKKNNLFLFLFCLKQMLRVYSRTWLHD